MEWSSEDKNAKVLIADDDDFHLSLLKDAIGLHGFKVETANNGLEAINRFEAFAPDIVLLDVDMPEMNGFQVCQIIRNYAHGRYIPIMMITGLDDLNSIQTAYKMGADDFVTKPINWPILGHRLFYLLKGSRALETIKVQEKREKALLKAITETILRFDEQQVLLDVHCGQLQEIGSRLKSNIGLTIDKALFAPLEEALSEQIKLYKEQNQNRTFEIKMSIADETRYLLSTMSKSDDNEYIFLLKDVTHEKNMNAQVAHMVQFDQLTRLPNRSYFEDEVSRAIHDIKTTRLVLSVMKCKLCQLSRINHSFGFITGDEAIKITANKIRQSIDDRTDFNAIVLARYVGDEFALLLLGQQTDVLLEHLAEMISATFEEVIDICGHKVHLQLAIGIASFKPNINDHDTLIKHADFALKHAKAQVNRKIAFFNQQVAAASNRKALIAFQLHHAVERDEFELHLQPKIHTESGQMRSLETLIRWQNPTLGRVSPGEFIPVAEQSGDILKIGQWVIKKAFEICYQLNKNRRQAIQVAINLSPEQFSEQEELVPLITFEALKTNINPAWIEFEITESVLISNLDRTVDTLNEIKSLGYSLAIDDFGTGYSSLSYLTQFPFNTLKIDQTFISALDDEKNRKLVKSIISMGHSLSMKIVAEGVETVEQLNCLKHFDCDYIQGYYYSKPLSLSDFYAFMVEQ